MSEMMIAIARTTVTTIVRFGFPTALFLMQGCSSSLHNLQHHSPKIRSEAALQMGADRDSTALEPLIAALADDDQTVRRSAAFALGTIGDPRAVEPLIRALSDDDWGIRGDASAAFALGEAGDVRAVEPLIAALEDSRQYPDEVSRRQHDDARASAALALGKLGDARAVEPLIRALQEDYYLIRENAASALGKIGDERAVVPLIAALGDWADVQVAAASALGAIGDSRAVAPLVGVLMKRDRTPGRVTEARATAALALGAIGDSMAVQPLITAFTMEVEREGSLLWFEPSIVRLDVEDVKRRSRFVDGEEVEKIRLREAVDSSLVAMGHVAVRPLIACLGSGNGNVRSWAASGLGRLNDERAIEPLIGLLKDDNPYVREAATTALVETDLPSLEPLFVALGREVWGIGPPDLEDMADRPDYYVGLGVPGSELLLIEALNKYGNVTMVNVFLSCGNSHLRSAGEEWVAARTAYEIQIVPMNLYRGQRWGQGVRGSR